MAIKDRMLSMSDGQGSLSVVGSANILSSDVVDLGANGEDGFGNAKTMDIGEAGILDWNVRVAADCNSKALTCTLTTRATNATITSADSTVATITVAASAVAGTKYSRKVPAGTVLRYLGTVYSGSNQGASTAIDNWIGMDHQTEP